MITRSTSRQGGDHEALRLEISKACYQLDFWSRHYRLNIWSQDRRKLEHDLLVMRSERDLEAVRLQLLDARNTILHEFKIAFGGRPQGQARSVDTARGVEVLVLRPADARRIAGHRLIVDGAKRADRYRDRLLLHWSKAQQLARTEQSRYDSEHARRITGGRLAGEFRTDAAADFNLQISTSPHRGYCFARVLDSQVELDNVFCLAHHAPGLQLRPGLRVRATVIQTPRGPQARNIRALG